VEKENERMEEPNSLETYTLQIEILNFQELSPQEIQKIIQDLEDEYVNMKIISLTHQENHKVNLEFVLKEKDYLREHYENELRRVPEISSNYKFLNSKSIQKIIGPSIKIKKNDALLQQSCNICFENYKENELFRTLPSCQHCFHKKCIDKWMKKRAQCPICRTNILEEHIKHMIQTEALICGINLF
jgi:hypothetical protein